jgi:hypothetical protein
VVTLVARRKRSQAPAVPPVPDANALPSEAERQLVAYPKGSPAWEEATIVAADAKARYLQAIEDARAAHTPEPPPFDEASAQA